MANQEHLDILMKGVEVWNQWRKEHPDTLPDLSYADLIGVNLNGADLSAANLSFTHLEGATLSGANLSNAQLSATLRKADLSRANLTNAHLSDADLRDANLHEAHLLGAYLKGTSLSDTDLKKADFRDAYLQFADLCRADLTAADLSGANLSFANLSFANLSFARINHAILVQTDLRQATLTNCEVYGISVWDVSLAGANQSGLIITDRHQPRFYVEFGGLVDHSNDPIITVDDLEVAQFIYLLLNYKKLRNVLNAVTAKGVLIFGRFGGGGLEVLHAIAAKLREEQYLPIVFDFERPQAHDYTETVKTLIGLVRFVIVDLSGPSVPQELSHTVPFFDIPFVPIIEKDRRSYAMFVDLLKYPWVLRPPIEFATVEELLARIPSEVIAPAEEKHQARQKLLDELFNKA